MQKRANTQSYLGSITNQKPVIKVWPNREFKGIVHPKKLILL